MIDLEDIYKNYSSDIVAKNKLLPKPCYGNSGGYYCNYECSKRDGCYGITMKKWGKCDCQFKPSCHLGRQSIQCEIKQRKGEKYSCDFEKYFDAEDYPVVCVPEGIIKMNPIED